MKCYLIIRGNIIHKKYFWFSGIACFDNCIYCVYVFTFTTILDSQVLKSVTLKRCITKQIQQVQWVENSLITIHMIENSLITSTFSDKQNNNCVDTTYPSLISAPIHTEDNHNFQLQCHSKIESPLD